jgi:hypothetical protein
MSKEKKGLPNPKLSAPRKGFKRITAAQSPFWAPWDKESGHPNPVVGVFTGERKIPPHGKFKEQTVLDITSDDGAFTVSLKGNLTQLYRAAQPLGVGQTVLVQWLEKVAPSEKMPMGQNFFDLQVEE